MSAIGVWIHEFYGALALRAERMLGYPGEKRKFYRAHGYRLNLSSPRSLNEKLVWKKIHDRNPLLPLAADKHAARAYVAEVLGENEARAILIPQLHVTDDPATIPFDSLPDDYIVKAGHASGRNIIVRGRDKDPAAIVAACRRWLSSSYGDFKHEWAYSGAERRIVVEALLRDSRGNIPADYKFFVIHGKCRMIQVDTDRFEHHFRSLFDPEWKPLDVKYKYPRGPAIERPFNFEKMLEIVERLGAPFDFVRVDLYAVADRIYFGELTHYPEAGMGRFAPSDFDFEMGRAWRLEPDYWKSDAFSKNAGETP